MEIDMVALRKELAKRGSQEIISLNKALRSAGQNIIVMNTDQLIAFVQWLQSKGLE